jgi:hypothetical protein
VRLTANLEVRGAKLARAKLARAKAVFEVFKLQSERLPTWGYSLAVYFNQVSF